MYRQQLSTRFSSSWSDAPQSNLTRVDSSIDRVSLVVPRESGM
jgi:hypothetical protein